VDDKQWFPVVDLRKHMIYAGIDFGPDSANIKHEVAKIITEEKNHRDILTLDDVLRMSPNTKAEDWTQYPSGGWAHEEGTLWGKENVPAGLMIPPPLRWSFNKETVDA
jgi:hypothetical protein